MRRNLVCLITLLVVVTAVPLAILTVVSQSHFVADALLWRLELIESRPTLSQRIYERRTLSYQLQQERLIPSGSALFFGDSHIQRLPTHRLSSGFNFAVGGQTANRLTETIGKFTSLKTARAFVIGAGTNDLLEGRSDEEILQAWRSLLDLLPSTTPVICVGLPVSKKEDPSSARKQKLSFAIGKLCHQHGHQSIQVVSGDGFFSGSTFENDGQHLNAIGSQILFRAIGEKLGERVPP